MSHASKGINRNLKAKALEALHASNDGMTVAELVEYIKGIDKPGVYKTLKRLPQTYVDRWTRGPTGHLTAVWAVVKVPEDCPRPPFKTEKRNGSS